MRIIFFGADRWFSAPILEALAAAGYEILLAVSKGEMVNKFKVQSSKFKVVDAKTSEDISLARFVSLLRSDLGRSDLSAPDAIILASFGPPFLSDELLKWPKYGCLNVHASLLPRWRGASPVFASLREGDKETGVSIMKMTEEIDRGPILGQTKLKIRTPGLQGGSLKDTPLRIIPDAINADTRETLTKRLGKLGGELIVETLKKLETGQIIETPQPAKSPTPYTRRLTKESGRIDWSKSPIEIERFIRAVTPWPGAWTEYRAKGQGLKAKGQTIKILKAHLSSSSSLGPWPLAPGPDLVIDEVQLAGKNPISWKQFLAGHHGVVLY